MIDFNEDTKEPTDEELNVEFINNCTQFNGIEFETVITYAIAHNREEIIEHLSYLIHARTSDQLRLAHIVSNNWLMKKVKELLRNEKVKSNI
jgi:hypothetical protein